MGGGGGVGGGGLGMHWDAIEFSLHISKCNTCEGGEAGGGGGRARAVGAVKGVLGCG